MLDQVNGAGCEPDDGPAEDLLLAIDGVADALPTLRDRVVLASLAGYLPGPRISEAAIIETVRAAYRVADAVLAVRKERDHG